MVRPFDIEEIFPDVATASVRLPRHQAGSSPQGLAVTLLADYTLRTGGWVPSAAIVALLGESHISAGSARTAISRLARRGVLEGSRHGRFSSYRLAQPAALSLSAGGHAILAFPARAEAWDGSWTLVAFSVPQDKGAQRRALRGQLRWLGFAPLYDGLWVSPRALTYRARREIAELSLGALTVFLARRVDLDAIVDRDPLNAWDVAEIAARYESFIRQWSPLLPRIRSGRVAGAEAVRARTQVMDTYRRFRYLDPALPMRLMPAGWPRLYARDVFVDIYDGLAVVAEDHIRTVVARFGDGQQPDILAHRTAQLLAGAGHVPALPVAVDQAAAFIRPATARMAHHPHDEDYPPID